MAPRRPAPDLTLLFGPNLPGAACAGSAPRWDLDPLPDETPDEREARLHAAATECRRCPARAACDAAADLDYWREPAAVWGGRVPYPLPLIRTAQ